MERYNVKVNGVEYVVEIEEDGAVAAPAAAPKAAAPAPAPKAAAPAAAPAPAPAPAAPAAAGAIVSPMPGTILKVNVAAGQAVKKGDVLIIIEAMKMENEIMALADGTVKAVHVAAGQTVDTGAALVTM